MTAIDTRAWLTAQAECIKQIGKILDWYDLSDDELREAVDVAEWLIEDSRDDLRAVAVAGELISHMCSEGHCPDPFTTKRGPVPKEILYVSAQLWSDYAAANGVVRVA